MSVRAGAWALACASAWLAGCSTAPVTIRDTRAQAPPALAAGAGCDVAVVRITDERLDPGVLGMVGPRVVRAPADVPGWIGSAFLALRRQGFDVHIGPAGAGELALEASLLKISVRSVTTSSIATSLVLRVRFLRDGVEQHSAVYRGDDASTNWTNGEGEIQGRVDDVVERALEAIRVDLSGLCGAPPPA